MRATNGCRSEKGFSSLSLLINQNRKAAKTSISGVSRPVIPDVEKTKSKKAREIPINSILFDVLTKLKANSGKSKVYFLLRVLELHLQMLVKEQALRISLFMI